MSLVIPKTLKMVVVAVLLGAQDKWTSSTGNLPRKCRDITEQLLKAALNTTNQSIVFEKK